MPQANGWEPYRTADGWNWRVWSHGQVIAQHQQGYENWDDMVDATLSAANWIIAADRNGLLDEPPT